MNGNTDQEYLAMQYEIQKQHSRHNSSGASSNEKQLESKPFSRETAEGDPNKEERRSKSRHRSKSQSRHRSVSRHRVLDNKVEEDMQQLQITSKTAGDGNNESLREYWKRRAEEENNSKPQENTRNNPPNKEGSERDIYKQLERHHGRSKSRGRSTRDNIDRKKVDSIASAIGSHKKLREDTTPLHVALEKSDWDLLNTTLVSLAESESSSVAAQLSVSRHAIVVTSVMLKIEVLICLLSTMYFRYHIQLKEEQHYT